MKRPTWATIVGVLTIIFGLFGILGGAQEIAMPYVLDMQSEMLEAMKESQVKSSENDENMDPMAMADVMESMLNYPEWMRVWFPISGIISIVISAAYFLNGVFLLMVKPFAIRFFYLTVGLSVAWAVVSSAVMMIGGSAMLLAQIPWQIGSVAIDTVLLVVVAVGNKEGYQVEI
ncbi:MAG: hypothetical protein AAF525_07580 [Pseudomonadota bacterium]